jgi:YD repeat-containing protein
VVSTATPAVGGVWLVTTNSYDGASSRLVRSETAGLPPVVYTFDALGDPVGTTRSGITVASDTRYEAVSNEIWRVTTGTTAAQGITNAVETTREQMTGLSADLRGRTVTVSTDGAVTTVERSFNPATKTETTTSWTDGATPTIQSTKFGVLVETHSLAERTVRYYDAFLAPYHVRTYHPVTGALVSRQFLGLDESTWDPVNTLARYGDGLDVPGWVEFDAWGRELVRTDALGHAVTNSYDALGRRVAVSGAAYPTRHEYDSMDRMWNLATTRDGSTWDSTAWLYDAASGLVTNKVYADNSRIGYTHTADGRPVRTTWARGAWRENGYTTDGLPASVAYSDTTPAVSLAYDAQQYPIAASNAVAQYA